MKDNKKDNKDKKLTNNVDRHIVIHSSRRYGRKYALLETYGVSFLDVKPKSRGSSGYTQEQLNELLK